MRIERFQIDGTYAALAIVLAFAHLAISVALVAWTFDESINRAKRGLPPTRQQQIVDGVLVAMHPLTAAVGASVNSAGRLFSIPLALFLASVDSVIWGCAAAWLMRWLRRTFWPKQLD